MGKEADKTESKLKNYLIYFLVIFCFVAIPGFILSYSVYRYFQTNEEELVYKLKIYMQHTLSELRRNVAGEKYFCRLFHRYNKKEVDNPNSKIESTIEFCKKQKQIYGDNIDFIVLTNDAEIKYNTRPDFYSYPTNVWKGAFYYFKSRNSLDINLKSGHNFANLDYVKKILGPQFVNVNLDFIYDENYYALYWTDSSENKFPSAVYTFKWGGLFVFISNDLLKSYSHLKYNIIDYSTNDDYVIGLKRIDKKEDLFFTKEDYQNNKEINKVLNESNNLLKNFIETSNYYICNQSLTKNHNVFVIRKKINTNFVLLLKALFVFILYFILSIPILKYFWNTIILSKSGKASIRLKIAFLFFFATGIPLLIFSVVSHEYELHKRFYLINEAKLWSVEKLLGIEKKYQAQQKKIANELSVFIDKWSPNLKNNGLTMKNHQLLIKKIENLKVMDYYVVSSETPYIGAYNSIVKINGTLDNMSFDLNKSFFNPEFEGDLKSLKSFVGRKFTDFESIIVICKKLFSDLNGKEIPSLIVSKLELIIESFLQKSFPEILYSIVERVDNIKEWGFGNRVLLTYFKMISCYKKGIYDYIVMVTWWPDNFQQIFVHDFISKENRNSLGFKMFALERASNNFIPGNLKRSKELVDFMNKASLKPTEELEIINYDGEDYIAVSFVEKSLSKYSFVGLYPLKNIDLEMNKLSFLFWLLGVLSLILAIGLAQLLTKSFVNPLLKLREGALAIENRDFKYRLSIPNIDEFGEVSDIFNQMMVGLQELEIAKIIQESMFPKPEFSQGKFSIYGKSVTMIDVGGDYLDFFKVDDNSFAALLGDVAGHGVGAGVIMAMAKATILVSGDYLKSPAAILNELHKIILSAKSARQKKIMTFQYIFVNSETGENLYSNAGGCSPFLIRRSTNSITELKKPGPVLGAFKKAKYTEMSFDFQPGDTIVFYTDGIVECKDKKGEMLGYDRLKELLLNCYDSNPKIYYENIYNAYLNYIGVDTKAEDDLTIIVLVYKEEIEEDKQLVVSD